MVFAEILGPDMLVILAIVALLFGGSQLPKLARSLGSAKSEFEKGMRESEAEPAPAAPASEPPALEAPPPEAPAPVQPDEHAS